MKSLSEALRKFRKDNNLTCRDMAQIANVSPQFISMVERGVTFPQIEELEKIAKALNVSLNEIIKITYVETQKKGVYKTYLSQKELKARK